MSDNIDIKELSRKIAQDIKSGKSEEYSDEDNTESEFEKIKELEKIKHKKEKKLKKQLLKLEKEEKEDIVIESQNNNNSFLSQSFIKQSLLLFILFIVFSQKSLSDPILNLIPITMIKENDNIKLILISIIFSVVYIISNLYII